MTFLHAAAVPGSVLGFVALIFRYRREDRQGEREHKEEMARIGLTRHAYDKERDPAVLETYFSTLRIPKE